VHIGDRESDIYELYCLVSELGTHFLVRPCVNRLAENSTLEEEMDNILPEGKEKYQIMLRQDEGRVREITLNVRWKRITLHPPIVKAK